MSEKEKKLAAATVITTHANADFDALAAMIAASKLYPGAALIFPGSQEKNLRNFYIQSTTYLFNFKSFKDIDPDSVELLVVVDTRQKSRLTHVKALLDRPNLAIHAFDHHPDSAEDVAAQKSLVLPWGSTTAVLVEEIRKRGLSLNQEEATMLGLGIFEDTGSFSFDSTTEHDFEAAAWLRQNGMDLSVIADLLSRDLSSEQVSILGDLLDSASTHDIHGVEVVIAEVRTEQFVSDFAFLVHKLIDMENIRVLFALGQMGDRIHLVARSKSPDVNVGHICSFFGGGGHTYAASATIKDRTLSEVRDELFALLYSHIRPKFVVESLMSRPAVTIEDDRTMAHAVEIMTRFGLKGIPVLAAGTQRCVGLLEHKIADKAVSHGLGEQPVSEYMVQKFSSVPPGADLYHVTEIILGKQQRLVPVVAEDEIKGVITRTDLINLLVDEPARIPESLLPERQRDRNIRSVMRTRLPEPMYRLLEEAGRLGHDLGFEVYAVGGFVRDILLGRPNLDLDLVVEGDGIRFAEELIKKLGGRVKPHQKFKTAVAVLADGQRVDVATARLEYYEHPAALPTVELSSIKMDLMRRDFTINALAVQINPDKFGEVVDFFGAQRDIKDRAVRVLHSLSFVEDPTRILRAIRFEQRFGFRIGPQTARLIKNAVQLSLFNRLSGARVANELKLIMDEENCVACLERMQEFKLFQAVHPLLELTPQRLAVIGELQKVLNWYRLLYLESEASAWKLYLLGLTMGLEREGLIGICRRLAFSGREEREIVSLRDMIGETLMRLMEWRETDSSISALCFLLEPLPLEGVLFLMAKSRKEEIRRHISQYLARLRFQTIEVGGEDLRALGLAPGPEYARILKAVKAARLDGAAETREKQLALARKLVAALPGTGS
jgi:tRNA nucleotidyltransferase (CCA-adding enzyme)